MLRWETGANRPGRAETCDTFGGFAVRELSTQASVVAGALRVVKRSICMAGLANQSPRGITA
jgi:hypothetical protein